jgi:hypothetical protein
VRIKAKGPETAVDLDPEIRTQTKIKSGAVEKSVPNRMPVVDATTSEIQQAKNKNEPFTASQTNQTKSRAVRLEKPTARKTGVTDSMEEAHLREAIASLDTKLVSLRQENQKIYQDAREKENNCDPREAKQQKWQPHPFHDNDNNNNNDDDDVDSKDSHHHISYGGGTHVRVGSMTAAKDRCSLEKRMNMSSNVYKTRVRKGPVLLTEENASTQEKPKQDKVTVKKNLAFMLLG